MARVPFFKAKRKPASLSPDDFIFENEDGGFLDTDKFRKRVLHKIARKLRLPKLTFQVIVERSQLLRRKRERSRTFKLSCGIYARLPPPMSKLRRFRRAFNRPSTPSIQICESRMRWLRYRIVASREDSTDVSGESSTLIDLKEIRAVRSRWQERCQYHSIIGRDGPGRFNRVAQSAFRLTMPVGPLLLLPFEN